MAQTTLTSGVGGGLGGWDSGEKTGRSMKCHALAGREGAVFA